MTSPPVASLADLLISVLERGVVLAIRLDGSPGDRRLLVGFGLTSSADPILMALCAAGTFRRHENPVEFDDELDWDI